MSLTSCPCPPAQGLALQPPSRAFHHSHAATSKSREGKLRSEAARAAPVIASQMVPWLWGRCKKSLIVKQTPHSNSSAPWTVSKLARWSLPSRRCQKCQRCVRRRRCWRCRWQRCEILSTRHPGAGRLLTLLQTSRSRRCRELLHRRVLQCLSRSSARKLMTAWRERRRRAVQLGEKSLHRPLCRPRRLVPLFALCLLQQLRP
mmetsp:Transcript_52715/g.113868  ORF Transcript_52715/g.113868 Transcript_52715/m.113868 type:complete len:203 (+) Transcript_52715:722-1330(+)